MIVEIERERLSAIMRVLVDSGDMTPMAVRQINNVVDDEIERAAGRTVEWARSMFGTPTDLPAGEEGDSDGSDPGNET